MKLSLERLRRGLMIGGPVLLCLGALLFRAGMEVPASDARSAKSQSVSYHRIVSLSPALTEVMLALGLNDRLAGITRDDSEAARKTGAPSVGRFLDPNYEAIVSLRPDIVLLLPFQEDHKTRLTALGVSCLTVKQMSLEDVFDSITQIGEVCGVQDRALKLETELRAQLQGLVEKARGQARPRVLICAGRDYSAPDLQQVYVAGKKTFYNEMLEAAGGENACCSDGVVEYPMLSAEGILRINPDAVIEVHASPNDIGVDAQRAIAAWGSLPSLEAVQHGRVYVLTGDYVTAPGPHVVRVVEGLFRLLHPNLTLSARAPSDKD